MEDDNSPLPKENENPAPEHVPDPVQTETAHDDTRDIVDRLVSEVDSLKETVANLVPQEQDTSPVKRPWTHKRFF